MATDAARVDWFPMVVLVAFHTGDVFMVLIQPVARHGVVIKLQGHAFPSVRPMAF